jgi:hypothetical protein
MALGLFLLLMSVDISPLYRWSEGERVRLGYALCPPALGSYQKLGTCKRSRSYGTDRMARVWPVGQRALTDADWHGR